MDLRTYFYNVYESLLKVNMTKSYVYVGTV